MNIKFNDCKWQEDYIAVSSDLLEDRMNFEITEDSISAYAGLSREDSIEMANSILEFWERNPKLNI